MTSPSSCGDPPRLTAPGLLGTRLEHLASCVDDPAVLESTARAVGKLTFGDMPEAVLQALRVGELVAMDKGAGEVRPLLVGAALQRLGMRALARVKKTRLHAAAGPHQYGAGRVSGADLVFKATAGASGAETE